MKLGKTVTITFTVTSHSTDGEELDSRTGSVQLESQQIYTEDVWTGKPFLDKVLYQFFIDIKKQIYGKV